MEKETMAKEESLSVTHPELAARWHPTLNGDLTPDMVTASHLEKRIWWKCSNCGKDYLQAVVFAVRKDDGRCPFCRERKAVPEEDYSLAKNAPQLAAQWHPTRNGDLTPEGVSFASQKTVWWICDKGHEWKARIRCRHKEYSRLYWQAYGDAYNKAIRETPDEPFDELDIKIDKNFGCPFCASRKLLSGFNDLATTHPALSAEWHPTKNGDLTPSMVTAGSGRKVWWRCKEGHEWEAQIKNRKYGRNCPICSNRKTLASVNDLVTTHPAIAAQWHPVKNGSLTPQQVTAGSNKRVWWICEKGHEWKTMVIHRTEGNNCPYCSEHFHRKHLPPYSS